MPHNKAMDEIGPSVVSTRAIISRCNRIIDFAKYVNEICIKNEPGMDEKWAEKWMDAIIREADLNDEWIKGS